MIKSFYGNTPKIHESCFIAENATVIGAVKLDKNVSVWYGAVIRGDDDSIVIGENSNVQDNSVIHNNQGYPVRIGKSVTIGHGAIIHGAELEDYVLVGMGAILMDGVKVGKNSIIGAGALCTEGMVIPEGSVVVGSPAKVIKKSEERNHIYADSNATAYIALAEAHKE